MTLQKPSELVSALLRAHQVSGPHHHVEQLVHYVELLARWGKQINLTGKPDPATIIERHLTDAVVLVSLLDRQPRRNPRFVDVGSGAGLPGLPVAILRDTVAVTLVEPLQKRVAFLRTAIFELGIAVEVHPQRAEQLRLPPFDIVCSRATWNIQEWLQIARTLRTADGCVVTFSAKPTPSHDLPSDLQEVGLASYALADGTPRTIQLLGTRPAP